MLKVRLVFALFCCVAVFCVPSRAHGQQAPKPLPQHWTDKQRQDVYTTSQGSRMMPYDWFLALEVAESETMFLADGLARFGYLPNANREGNPDGLPVGFVKDPKRSKKDKDYVGLNCSACHTNQIRFKDTVFQIDGGPAQADMYALLDAIGRSLQATLHDTAKFDRFASRVLGSGNTGTRNLDNLRGALDEFTSYWLKYVTSSTSPVPWGRARLDAFGMIFNRAAGIDTQEWDKTDANGKMGNIEPPNAPVSYPFLWGTSFENVVQWNGIAPNTNDLLRLSRNVGEVLGVFAQANLHEKPRPLHRFYETSAQRWNQLWIENQLKELWSPQWPAEFGPIDDAKKTAGKALFDQHCVRCHVVIDHGKQNTPVTVHMSPLSDVGTDPMMAENAARRMVNSGPLEGAQLIPLLGSKLPARLPAAQFLLHAVAGAILEPRIEPLAAKRAINEFDTDALNGIEALVSGKFRLETVFDPLSRDLKEFVSSSLDLIPKGTSDDQLKYKGRPLDGIWATAPYLHNGSVANLYEILLPPDKRMKTFYVGNPEFDPSGVGFTTSAAPNATVLDTALPGNSNAGHDYGNSELNDEQRWQLVEYMKSL